MRLRISGFSLIELMVTVTIAAILLAIAVPNLSGMIKANRTQSQARELYSQLMYARSEAISRGHWVTVCSSSDGTNCGGTWSNGWIICDEGNTANPAGLCGGTSVLRTYFDVGTNTVTVVDATSAAQTSVSFNKLGQTFNTNGVTFKVCDVDNNVKYARAVLKAGIGQVVASLKNTSTGIYQDVNQGDLTCP